MRTIGNRNAYSAIALGLILIARQERLVTSPIQDRVRDESDSSIDM